MYIQSYNLCNAGQAKYTKDYLTRGGKIFLAYLLIVYIFPLVINLVYDSEPIFRLPIHSETVLLSLLLLIFVSIFAIAVSRYTPTVTPKNKGPIKPLPRWFIILISLVAISVGYTVFSAGLSQWRYTTTISAESSLLYVSLIQTFMPALSYWILITDHQLMRSRSRFDMLVKALFLFGLVFSINGLGSIFVTLLFALVFIAPHSMLILLFKDSSNNRKKIYRYLGIAIILPLVSIPLIMAGLYSKSGVGAEEEESSFQESTLVYTGLNYLINRHSIHLSSLAASLEDGPNYADLIIPIDATVFRLKVVTGLDPDAQKPEINSFSRRAILQFADYRNVNPRGGSSPGLLASITMVLPLPLAIFCVFFATFLLIKLTDLILCRQPPLSFIGALTFAYIPFKLVTDSPFDLLIPGPVIITLFFIFILSFRREKIFN
jgi:hypothetical protein